LLSLDFQYGAEQSAACVAGLNDDIAASIAEDVVSRINGMDREAVSKILALMPALAGKKYPPIDIGSKANRFLQCRHRRGKARNDRFAAGDPPSDRRSIKARNNSLQVSTHVLATDLPKHIRLLPISAQSPHDLPAEQPAISRTDRRPASLRSDEPGWLPRNWIAADLPELKGLNGLKELKGLKGLKE